MNTAFFSLRFSLWALSLVTQFLLYVMLVLWGIWSVGCAYRGNHWYIPFVISQKIAVCGLSSHMLFLVVATLLLCGCFLLFSVTLWSLSKMRDIWNLRDLANIHDVMVTLIHDKSAIWCGIDCGIANLGLWLFLWNKLLCINGTSNLRPACSSASCIMILSSKLVSFACIFQIFVQIVCWNPWFISIASCSYTCTESHTAYFWDCYLELGLV